MCSGNKSTTPNNEFVMSAVNEALIRDVVQEVLGRLGQPAAKSVPASPPPVTAAAPACGCDGKNQVSGGSMGQGKYGVFQDANEACTAAHEAYLQLQRKGVAARAR